MQTPSRILLSRRTILTGASILLLVFLFLIPFARSHPHGTTKEKEPETVAYDKTTRRVFIKDFYTYGDYFTPEKQQAIEASLYTYAHASQQKEAPDLYTGVIRKKSFLQTKDAKGVMTTSLLVDIGPVGVTYSIRTTGTTKDGAMPVVIQCALRDQQENTSITCVDGMQRRE